MQEKLFEQLKHFLITNKSDPWYSILKKLVRIIIIIINQPYILIGWLYSAYLTLRFVDERNFFPSFRFKKRIIKLEINKRKNSHFCVGGRIIIDPWIDTFTSEISIGESASLTIKNDFIIGDDVHIRLSKDAQAEFIGKIHTSGSGITARSIIMIEKYLYLGADVIIAWDTFITDSDWHGIEGNERSAQVTIEDHVWIANGVKVLKGSYISKNSIVACGSVVIGGTYSERSLIGGVPAKIIKTGIEDWQR